MTATELIKYLRLSVGIQDPSTVTDTTYLSLTDEDLSLYVKVVLTRDFPEVVSIDSIPSEDVYPVTLLAKKELYYALAVSSAPSVNVVADNNNQLQRGQRFDHYMKLIAQVDLEYNQYNADGGAGTRNTLTSYSVVLPNRYATKYNREHSVAPALSLHLDKVTDTSIELYWDVYVSHFKGYKVYISSTLIHDEHDPLHPVSDEATLVFDFQDVHFNKCRIEGLTPGTVYQVMVSATDLSSLVGYSEITVSTLAAKETSP